MCFVRCKVARQPTSCSLAIDVNSEISIFIWLFIRGHKLLNSFAKESRMHCHSNSTTYVQLLLHTCQPREYLTKAETLASYISQHILAGSTFFTMLWKTSVAYYMPSTALIDRSNLFCVKWFKLNEDTSATVQIKSAT